MHLAVDHGDQLAGLYGRHLQLRLRRTDPPPGSLAGQEHPDDETISVVWGALYDRYRPLGQLRFLQAVREAPCLEEPSLGGTTGEVTADLVPGAWYDLMLMATPSAQPDAEDVVVSRAHFQASRYHDESELLGALGFGVPGPTAFIAPDAMVTAAVPGGALAGRRHRPRRGARRRRASTRGRCPTRPAPRSSGCDDAGDVEARRPAARGAGADRPHRADGARRDRVQLRRPRPRPALPQPGRDARPAHAARTRRGPRRRTISLTLTRTVTDAAGTTTSTAVTGSRFAIDVPRTVRMEAGT